MEVKEMNLFESNEDKAAEVTEKELLESLQKKVEKIREDEWRSFLPSIEFSTNDYQLLYGTEHYALFTILNYMVFKQLSFNDAFKDWEDQVKKYNNSGYYERLAWERSQYRRRSTLEDLEIPLELIHLYYSRLFPAEITAELWKNKKVTPPLSAKEIAEQLASLK